MKLFHGIHIRLVGKNALSLFAIRTVSSTATFLITTLLVSNLGYEAMGSFTKITAVVSILYVVLDAGMNPVFLKTYEQTKENLSKFITLRLILSLAVSILLAIAAILLPHSLFTFSDFERIGLLIFSLTLIPYGIQLSITSHFQAGFSQQKTILPNTISTLTLLALSFSGITSGNLYLILFAYPVSSIVLTLFLFFKLNLPLTTHQKELLSFFRKMLLLSLPFAIVFFINVLYSKIDILALSILKSTAEVGIYGYSYRIFELFLTIPLFISTSMYPLIAKSKSNTEWLKIAQKYTILLFFLSLLSFVLLLVFTALLPLLNPAVSESMIPLRILGISLPFFFTTSIMQWILIKEGKKTFLIFTYLTSLVIVLFLNLLFIPKFTYNASAAATVIGEGFVWTLFIAYFIFHYPNFFRKKL